jgi:hypothetical protein
MQNIPKKSVFISHASKNFKLADEIRQLIEERNISCWIAPRDIPPGASYGEEIAGAIEHCIAVIFIMTEEANQSRPVANELELAFRFQRVIIPIRINEIQPSQRINFFVSNSQWVDAIYSPLKKRIDVLVNIINAAKNNTQIPYPTAENKTLLGTIERSLEGLIRYRILTLIAAFGVIALITTATWFNSSRSQYQIESDYNKVQLDPNTYGHIVLAQKIEKDNECKKNEMNLQATIYVNLNDPQKAGFELHSRRVSLNGEASRVDLSNIHPYESAGVQITTVCLPEETTRLTFCMSAEHPNLGKRYAAKWTYKIQKDKNEEIVSRQISPKMYGAELASCEINQL